MDTRYPRIQARTPLGDANRSVLSKLVRDTNTPGVNNTNRHYILTDPLSMNRISRNTAQNVVDSEAIMQVLPEMEHVIQIIVGTILNPKDMSNTDLNIAIDDNSFNSEMTRVLLEVVTDYFKKDYKMGDRLEKILEDIVARKGAYIQAVLPENALDLIINGERKISTEQFDTYISRFEQGRPLGILGAADLPEGFADRGLKANSISIESFTPEDQIKLQTVGFKDSELTVSDNFHLLKARTVNNRRARMRVNDLIKRESVSTEDRTDPRVGLTPDQVEDLYRRTTDSYQQTLIIEKPEFMERPSVGHPLVMDLDPAAVVPVFPPGRPYEPVGHFVLIDLYGRPVSTDSSSDYYNDMRTDFDKRYGQSDNSSELLRVTREALGGGDTQNKYEIEQIHQSYNSIVEADLKKRLVNGAYREEFELGFSEEVKRIMFSRHLKKQNTRLIYVPAELMVYSAFYYDSNGVGQSMLARSKILANMRSVLLFAETMAGVRNAVGRKKVNINLDPGDPDKTATVAEIQQLILESGRRGFPVGAPDPGQILDYLNRAGYDFSINANGAEDYHQMSVDYDDYNTNIQAGNPELQERLRKMHISSMSVPPEKADPENGAEFATSIVHNDLLFARRIRSMQKAFTDSLTKFVRVYTLNSSILVNKMLAKVKENPNMIATEYSGKPGIEMVEDFINALIVKLPEPDTSRTTLMLEMMEQHGQLLDKVLEAYITPDLFPEEFLIKGGSVDKAVAAIRAHFMRLFIQDNNILPAVGVLYEMEKGKPVFSLLDHQAMGFESLGTVVQEYIHQLEETRKQWAAKFVPTDASGGGTDDFGGGGDDSFGGGGDDSFGGGSDDFGGGDDLGGGDDGLGGGTDDFNMGGDGEGPLEGLNSGEEPSLDEPNAPADAQLGPDAEPEQPAEPELFGAPEPIEDSEVKDDEDKEDEQK
ncbi:hypothetical protein D3C81_331280 [compost metagenome]